MALAAHNSAELGVEPFLKAAAASAKDWKPGKGGLPLAAALGGMFLLSQLGKNMRENTTRAQDRSDMKRLVEADRNLGDRQSLMGGGQLSFPAALTYQAAQIENSAPDYTPFDKAAAVSAIEVGRALAKSAGIGGMALNALSAVNKAPNALFKGVQAVAKPIVSAMPSLGMGGKALAVGGTIGAGLLAHKAGKKALEFGMEPAQERRQGAPGPGLPRYVNEYGTPSM